MQFPTSTVLKPFVKSYQLVTVDRNLTDEVFYPSGFMDLVVKFPGGSAATIIDGSRKDTPEVELLGHLTVPTRLTAAKGTSILIARFFPYAGRLFFRHPMIDFTDQATDLTSVLSVEVTDLYDKISGRASIAEKVKELDDFLVGKFLSNQDRYRQTMMIADICTALPGDAGKVSVRGLSRRFGFSERYVEKLFLENVGLSPISLFSITRFNKALDLMRGSASSLTAIAHDCGYYDQAHFIKEFRRYTGIKPSLAKVSLAGNGPEFQQAVNLGL